MSATVFFKHKYITNPTVSPADIIISAANRMSKALRKYTPNNMCEEDVDALGRLKNIFKQAENHEEEAGIQPVETQISPRVQVEHQKKHHQNVIGRAIATLEKSPRVEESIFTPIEEEPFSPSLLSTACGRGTIRRSTFVLHPTSVRLRSSSPT